MTTLDGHSVIRTPAQGSVEVFDDIVPKDLRNDVLRLVRRPIWAYGWKSVRGHDRFGFWHAHFAGDEKGDGDCLGELARNEQADPIHKLWHVLTSSILHGHAPTRVYANGHTYGVEGSVHTDSEDERFFTTIYYAHGLWDASWAGETVFLSRESGDITHSILPAPGRVIMFCGATPHAARSLSRECPELRVSIVFKTRIQ